MKDQNQLILITGATDGIGEITAHTLAARGFHLLIHGRNKEKLNKVAREIRVKTGNEHIEEYLADFSSLQDVKKLAEKIQAGHASLDVLINNAGLGFSNQREESQDGYELRLAVNYLAPFLLTHLLIPQLQKAEAGRIVNVASAGQQEIDFDNLMLNKDYEAWRAYRQSKLALIMFTFSLAGQLKGEKITVNALHPGTFLNTKMVKEADITPQGKAEDGAEAVVYLATSADVKNVSGEYFNQKSKAKASDQAYNKEAQKKLWEISQKLTGI